MLGGSVECSPSGEVTTFDALEWALELPPGGTFELVVRDAATGERLMVHETRETSWRGEAARDFPARIRWTVTALDVTGAPTGVRCESVAWREDG